MGWGSGIVGGKEVGYNVEAVCDYPGCKVKIDRGVAYACGGDHGSFGDCCDGYFCHTHLFHHPVAGFICIECKKRLEKGGKS